LSCTLPAPHTNVIKGPRYFNIITTHSKHKSPHLRRSQTEHLRSAAKDLHCAHPTSSLSACTEDRNLLGNQQTNNLILKWLKIQAGHNLPKSVRRVCRSNVIKWGAPLIARLQQKHLELKKITWNTRRILFGSEVKWSYVEVFGDKRAMYSRVTLYWW